jgi:ubiquinone/menaquinone biosynthesis C-methylase UbiE
MAPRDPFAKIQSLDDRTLDALVQRFEARGRHPYFAKMLREYLDAMHVDDARSILDLGCGTGVAARAIVRWPRFAGRVTGVDRSAHLVAAAERLAREEGLADRTEFRTGDACSVEAADASFDAAVAHTLVSHVDDVMAVLEEAARVVRPGGTIGIFDGDYASLTFDHPDAERAKACDEALMSALAANPRVMRQMPRLLRAANLELVNSFSWVLSETGTANFWSSAFDVYGKLLPTTGVMTQEDADRWAAALRSDSDAGVFFGSCNYYAYVARRRSA